jgi:hypothetical protein
MEEHAMEELRIHVKGMGSGHVRPGATVGEALEQLGGEAAGGAVAATVDGREVDLAFRLALPDQSGRAVEIEPIRPDTLEGLGVIRHSTAHLLAAAVLDLFPGTKLGIGPALLDDPRFGFFHDVIAPRPITDADLPLIEARMRELAKRKLAHARGGGRSRGHSARLFLAGIIGRIYVGGLPRPDAVGLKHRVFSDLAEMRRTWRHDYEAAGREPAEPLTFVSLAYAEVHDTREHGGVLDSGVKVRRNARPGREEKPHCERPGLPWIAFDHHDSHASREGRWCSNPDHFVRGEHHVPAAKPTHSSPFVVPGWAGRRDHPTVVFG